MLAKVTGMGICVTIHQPHVLPGYGKLYQALFCEPYRVVHLCEIYSKPILFILPFLIFKGVHETTSLSWFFCDMTKEQEKKEFRLMYSFPSTSK